MKYINMNPFLNNVLDLSSENKVWDLRNDLDLLETRYNVIERIVFLIWKYPSEWLKNENRMQEDSKFIELKFEEVGFFEIISNEKNETNSENIYLDDIWNFHERRDGSYIRDNYLTFVFNNDLRIIIKAESIKLEIKNLN